MRCRRVAVNAAPAPGENQHGAVRRLGSDESSPIAAGDLYRRYGRQP